MGILTWIVVGLIFGFFEGQVLKWGGYGLIGETSLVGVSWRFAGVAGSEPPC